MNGKLIALRLDTLDPDPTFDVRVRGVWGTFAILDGDPNDVWLAQIAFREIQENFKPAIGFVQRDNVRMLRVAGSYNPRPENPLPTKVRMCIKCNKICS